MQRAYDLFLIVLIFTMFIMGPVFLLIFSFPQFSQRVVRALTLALGFA